MTFVFANRVKETSSTTGTGTLTLAGAVSGFQAFSVVGNGNLCKYTLLASSESAPTAWERGYATWATGGTLARTLVLDNSSGTTSAITLPAGTHTVILGWGADDARDTEVALHSMLPGGRLTLTSGTPVTTSDVTGATSIYYTPYVSNVITLWDGYRWHPIEFAETTLALGTLTSGKPYDVFAYLSSGALALEMLAWTNDTTRATAITIQDGRYCKSGDKTRLYLGTFYTTATTTTEDSENNRYLWNQYNQELKVVVGSSGANHTYTTASYREWNNGTSVTRAQWVNGNPLVVFFTGKFYLTGSSGIGNVHLGLDSTTTNAIDDGLWVYCGAVTEGVFAVPGRAIASAGKHFVTAQETGLNNQTLYEFSARGLLPC